MAHAWDAERTIEETLALKLITEQFPELNAKTIRVLGAGWDNTAFIVNEKIIFRFPRRQVAVNLLQEESNFLPQLAPHLSLTIPNILWQGKATSDFPWPFSGYSFLPGRTACHENLTEASRHSLVKPVALFLKKLHSLSLQKFKTSFLSSKSSRIDGNLMNEKIKRNFNELTQLGLLDNRRELDFVVKNSQNFKKPTATSVVHGDFYVRHLLISESEELTGVIDWGNVHIGDPANDIAIAHSFLPIDAHAKFKEFYGDISEHTWQLSRLRAILSGTYLILFGHYSQDPTIKREGLRTLQVIGNSN